MFNTPIKDVFTPGVIGLPLQATVAEAIDAMRRHTISCIVVLDGDEPVGIFTERDLVRCMASPAEWRAARPVCEVMSADLATARDSMMLYEAFNLLGARKVRHLVVVGEHGQAVGIMTQTDLTRHIGFEFFIEFKKVERVMTTLVHSVGAGCSLRRLLPELAERGVSCLVVAEDGRPVGMVTERDMVRLAREKPEFYDLTAADVMSRPVVCVPLGTPVNEAANQMRDKGIRRLVVTGADGRIAGLITLSDIIKGMERKYIETLQQTLIEKEADLQTAMRDLSKKSAYLDSILSTAMDMGIVATDTELTVIYYNPAAEEILDVPARQVTGMNLRGVNLNGSVALERFERAIEAVRRNSVYSFSFEKESPRGRRFIQARISGTADKEGRLVGYVLMLSDETDSKKAQETIQHMAYHDYLTGLPNRLLFNERLQMELSRAERHGTHLALLALDLDRFKNVNDTLGHHAGDLLLKQVADRLRARLRKSDTVARMGGDEFTIILPEVRSAHQAVAAAEHIVRALSAPYCIEELSVSISACVGIAIHPVHGVDPESLQRAADKAMYTAKESRCQQNPQQVRVFAQDCLGLMLH